MLELARMLGVNLNLPLDTEEDTKRNDLDPSLQPSSLYNAMQVLLSSHDTAALRKHLLTLSEATDLKGSPENMKMKRLLSPDPLDSLISRSASTTTVPSDGYSFYDKSSECQRSYTKYDEAVGTNVSDCGSFLPAASLSADFERRHKSNTLSLPLRTMMSMPDFRSSTHFLSPDFTFDEKKLSIPSVAATMCTPQKEEIRVCEGANAASSLMYGDQSSSSFGGTEYETLDDEILLEKLMTTMSIEGIISSNEIGLTERKLLGELHMRLIKRYEKKLNLLQDNIELLSKGGKVHFDIVSEIFSMYPRINFRLLEPTKGAAPHSPPEMGNVMTYPNPVEMEESSSKYMPPSAWLDELLASTNMDSPTTGYALSIASIDKESPVHVLSSLDGKKGRVAASSSNEEEISMEGNETLAVNDRTIPIRRICTTTSPRGYKIKADEIRSLLHSQGCCKPCAFFYNKKKGCRNGASCEFCHHEDHGKHTLKHWKKQQQKLMVSEKVHLAEFVMALCLYERYTKILHTR
ncbi:hypothetical protein IE077_001265 [Cardiosporidium cionae]|uniref:C3H1-type domain-containing protein n=1 Tax=Cardiosporidium cionae TaxID=476202 RepID=A0ABQ7JEA5_9APIC|nr:hypothetical protein IE077_001265 [Cardiosporidium cionae]|eukprot:KAF8821980.1 hypothetical protein IE077_001265 [Cardiosporidium cionae]